MQRAWTGFTDITTIVGPAAEVHRHAEYNEPGRGQSAVTITAQLTDVNGNVVEVAQRRRHVDEDRCWWFVRIGHKCDGREWCRHDRLHHEHRGGRRLQLWRDGREQNRAAARAATSRQSRAHRPSILSL